MTSDALSKHFREQAGYCELFESPFTARLLERMADDVDAGGPVADLVAGWPGHPLADALSLRVAGALHAAVLTGRDPALSAEYPEQRAAWDMDAVWLHARAFLARERAWVAEFLRSPPQTNEVRRTIALLPGFLAFAAAIGDRAIDTLEIGASAGLNMHWDRFRYRTDSWSWGASDAGVIIDTIWHGPPPELAAQPRIHSRAACDQSPLDIRDSAQRMRLRSYIWADQHARLARFDAAVKLALASPAHVERADAAEWLARKLEQRATDRATIVYHSVFLQYPPRATRDAIKAAIAAAGERATEQNPLALLRLEPEALIGTRRDSIDSLVDLTTWPGNVHRVLALSDGHVRFVKHPPPPAPV